MLVAAAASAWGTWPVFLRRAEAIAPMPAALESGMLMAVLALASAPLLRVDRVQVRASARDWAGVAWLGVGDAMNAFLFFAAYQRTSVAIAVLTHYLTPIFVALAAPFALSERATKRSVAAVGVSFAGLVLLLQPWRAASRPGDWVGAALGAGSAVFYASNVLVNKRLIGVFSGSELAFWHAIVAAPLLALFVPMGAWSHLDARAVAVVLVGSIGPGALAGLAFVWGLRRIPASHASTLALFEPLVAVLIGALFFRENPTIVGALGGVMIVSGATLVMLRPRSGGG
jgi:drug/metabolite transporter (DMT)-like permease